MSTSAVPGARPCEDAGSPRITSSKASSSASTVTQTSVCASASPAARAPGAALHERSARRACGSRRRERKAGVEDPLGDRQAHVPEPERAALARWSIHPPSTSRFMAVHAAVLEQERDAATISSMVTVRPSGVRAATALEHLRLARPLGRVADDARGGSR